MSEFIIASCLFCFAALLYVSFRDCLLACSTEFVNYPVRCDVGVVASCLWSREAYIGSRVRHSPNQSWLVPPYDFLRRLVLMSAFVSLRLDTRRVISCLLRFSSTATLDSPANMLCLEIYSYGGLVVSQTQRSVFTYYFFICSSHTISLALLLAQFSLNNVHKRGLKQHHFI